jgi:hypothetical protein
MVTDIVFEIKILQQIRILQQNDNIMTLHYIVFPNPVLTPYRIDLKYFSQHSLIVCSSLGVYTQAE